MTTPPTNEQPEYVFDLETAISTWMQFLSRNSALLPEDLDELEDHLRLELEDLNASGISDERRFRLACERIGDIAEISSAYQKVVWEKHMIQKPLKERLRAAINLSSSYVKTAWTGIIRQKGYAVLNLAGLSIALAACIVIVLYVQRELSYDRFNENADRVYRIETFNPNFAGDNKRTPTVRWPVAELLKTSIPEIETLVRLQPDKQSIIQVGQNQFVEDRVLITEPEFFDVFDVNVFSGSSEGLSTPNTVLISESMASKYFTGQNPVGQIIQIGDRSADAPVDFEIIGVFQDLPSTAHFGAEFITSLATLGTLDPSVGIFRTIYAYIVLQEQSGESVVRQKLTEYWTDHVAVLEHLGGTEPRLMPLTDIHLFSSAMYDIEPQGDINYVMMFVLVAFLLLLVACVNYMNLAVSRYLSRAKEVGIRKVVGAHRGQLIGQFLGESLVYAGIAFVVALGMAALILPTFSTVMDIQLDLYSTGWSTIVLFIPLVLGVGLISGSYPAFFLSKFSPATVFRGVLGPQNKALFRKALLSFQFVVTSGLIVGTLVVSLQMRFVQDQNLGAANDQILLLKTEGALSDNQEAFKTSLAAIPGVESVSYSYNFPGHQGAISFFNSDEIEMYEGEPLVLDQIWADEVFAQTIGLELIAGRLFSPDRAGDSENGVILNETAVKAFGWTDPIGKRIGLDDREKTVIGVVKDFHMTSMYEEIRPFILEMSLNTRMTGLLVSTATIGETLKSVEGVWEQFIPLFPFEYSFLDDDFKAMYRKETRLGQLFTAFSVLTILIAVLGLFGLVSFSANQRTKEIGIRKTMGASAGNITVLLSREYAGLIILSFLLATPIIYMIMQNWLDQFVYRIDLGIGMFALSGLILLVTTLGTVSLRAMRSAKSSPVECLRS